MTTSKPSTCNQFHFHNPKSTTPRMELTSSVRKLAPGDPGVELDYDRDKEVKEFDETKAGINGLVDSGVTKVPRFLIHPPESLPNPMLSPATTQFKVPVIDLEGLI